MKVEMNKPVYFGLCVLDLSKIIMYEFHYDYIKAKYEYKARLMYIDTDSLVYHIETGTFIAISQETWRKDSIQVTILETIKDRYKLG